MLHLEMTDQAVDFFNGDRLAGRYNVADPFKPFIHPLNTPAGETMSLAMPHDHKHHKGLMYALRTPEVNFWEEVSTLPGERPGRQRHERFEETTTDGDQIGFVEHLSWVDADDAPWFAEQRTIRLSVDPADGAYLWTWGTVIESLRDTKLIQS